MGIAKVRLKKVLVYHTASRHRHPDLFVEIVRTHLAKAPAQKQELAPMVVHPGSKRRGRAEDPPKKRARTSVGEVKPYDFSGVRPQVDRVKVAMDEGKLALFRRMSYSPETRTPWRGRG